jgi:hypothetical protein
MTVTSKLPRLIWIGSLHPLAVTHRDGSNWKVPGVEVLRGDPVCAAPA